MYMRDQNFMLWQLLIGIYYNENMDVARETDPAMQCWCSRRRRFVFEDSIYKNYEAKREIRQRVRTSRKLHAGVEY